MRRNRVLIRVLVSAAALLAWTAPAIAQEALSADMRASVVEGLAEAIRSNYVLEEKGAEIASGLLARHKEGRFDRAATLDDLAFALTMEMRALSGDLHLRVSRTGQDPASGIAIGEGCQGPGQDPAPAVAPSVYTDRILAGNVGLLEVGALVPPLDAMERSLKALAGADAVILDLRRCPGGGLEAIPALASAFFDHPQHLVTLKVRGTEPVRVSTLEKPLGGVRFAGKPAFILTSESTGSGCEEFAYDLKYHEKAVLVGEKTAGAGHGSVRGVTDIGHGLEAFIPDMRPEHPRHPDGFEGVGVPPDVSVPASDALDVAHTLALSRILEGTKDESRRRSLERAILDVSIRSARQRLDRVATERPLRELEGIFAGGKRIVVRDGALWMEFPTPPPAPLVEEGQDTYALLGTPGQKVRLVRDDGGAITAVEISAPGGGSWRRSDRVAKD